MTDLEQLRTFRADEAIAPPPVADVLAKGWSAHIEHQRAARRGRRKLVGVAAGVAALAVVGGVVAASASHNAEHSKPDYVVGQTLTRVAIDSPQSVVSWADAVVVATAESAVDVDDKDQHEAASGDEPLIYRNVAFAIKDVLWQRPGAKPVSNSVVLQTTGWATSHDHERTRFVLEGAPWIEVGEDYLIPIATDKGALTIIEPAAVFPVTGGRVEPEDGQSTDFAQALRHRDLTAARLVLSAAKPIQAVDPAPTLDFNARLCRYEKRLGVADPNQCG